MNFNPSVAQLCTIAELSHARAPVATIARELHIPAEDFIAWRQRCMKAAANESARLQRREPMPVAAPPEGHARMTAARLFEMPEPEQRNGETT
jgi:hypothetical protein